VLKALYCQKPEAVRTEVQAYPDLLAEMYQEEENKPRFRRDLFDSGLQDLVAALPVEVLPANEGNPPEAIPQEVLGLNPPPLLHRQVVISPENPAYEDFDVAEAEQADGPLLRQHKVKGGIF